MVMMAANVGQMIRRNCFKCMMRKGVKPRELLEGSSALNFPGIERCRDDIDPVLLNVYGVQE
jgi:hypothetical protein